MGSNNLEETLKHFGIKGMKWGVRRDRTVSRQNGGKTTSGKKSRTRQEIDSAVRELSFLRKSMKSDKMSTKEISQHARRLQMENEFKRLSSTVGSGSSKRANKEQYRLRSKMSDEELNRKVVRLRAQDSLARNAREATKKQKELGKKVVSMLEPVVISAVKSRNEAFGEILGNVSTVVKANSALQKGDYDKAQSMVEKLYKESKK